MSAVLRFELFPAHNWEKCFPFHHFSALCLGYFREKFETATLGFDPLFFSFHCDDEVIRFRKRICHALFESIASS
jgi:hypothetical protein